MFRLLLIAVLFGLIFWLVKGYGRESGSAGHSRELVRDAFSGVYFPKDLSVSVTRGGETLYFLNKENRDKYLSLNR